MNSGPPSFNSLNPGLAGKVIQFSDFLKNRGFRVSHSNVHDSLRSIADIDPAVKEDFLATLRANLVKNDIEWGRFTKLFLEFWSQETDEPSHSDSGDTPTGQQPQESAATCESFFETITDRPPADNYPDRNRCVQETAYSPMQATGDKIITCFDKTDIPATQLALKKIIRSFWVHETRRFKRSKKALHIDISRVMRKSLKYEGLLLELYFKARKKKLKRAVFLIDVSGSMDRYAQLVFPFILSLRTVGAKAEIFVFSTSLVPVNIFVRNMDIDQLVDNMIQNVPDWSGGTRIGRSFQQFNQNQGRRLLNRRTVVIILSDGWDLGEKELLRQEMMILKRKADSIIWLNPLAGDANYQPLCQGMRAALPYVDYFLPADSPENLDQAGRLLCRLMVH